jgi:uncharacterized protein DUF6777
MPDEPSEDSPDETTPSDETRPADVAKSDDATTEAVAYSKLADEPEMEAFAPSTPWWRRPAVLGLIAGGLALALAIVLVVVLVVLPDSSHQAAPQGEVFLEPASAAGQDPFSPNYATPQQPPPQDPGPPPAPPAASPGAIQAVDGSQPGTFGGTMNLTTCDAEGLIVYLAQHPDKGRAWASVFGITPEQIPAFIRELTPVLLRADTRVTNHGYFNGRVVARQSVLEAGTAVLVNKFGEPTVRCYCGNPLLPPIALKAPPVYKPVSGGGYTWKKFNPTTIIIIKKSVVIIEIFRLWDPWLRWWFWRYRGIRIIDLLFDPNVRPPLRPPLPPAVPPVQPALPLPPQAPPSTYVPPPAYTQQPTYTEPPYTPPQTTVIEEPPHTSTIYYPPTTEYMPPHTPYTDPGYTPGPMPPHQQQPAAPPPPDGQSGFCTPPMHLEGDVCVH